jgi:hypothetical protein
MAKAAVPRHGEAFDEPMDFRMYSWKEEFQLVDDGVTRFPELAECRSKNHAVVVLSLKLAAGEARTVGCWKCRTCVYKGRVVTIKEAYGPEWTGN